ncbi:hypothetical protein WN51_09707 [Melipona quadrifasciata]|uniref:Uncharacterized protein n=1 Tax=Melipona quadrifasciata TaxID=166423 RepID=A0A0M9A521_9HYME|nr:hypothetical protein WN51_09707 [Melipona quadrifasciata]
MEETLPDVRESYSRVLHVDHMPPDALASNLNIHTFHSHRGMILLCMEITLARKSTRGGEIFKLSELSQPYKNLRKMRVTSLKIETRIKNCKSTELLGPALTLHHEIRHITLRSRKAIPNPEF